MFCLEVSDYQNTDARKKNKYFLIENPFTGAVFSIGLLMEEIKLVLAQK